MLNESLMALLESLSEGGERAPTAGPLICFSMCPMGGSTTGRNLIYRIYVN